MTLIDPSTTTKRRRRRPSTSVTTTSAPARSTGVRIVRAILTGIWLVGVPAFAGLYVDRNFGAPLGSIPLGAGSPGLSIASLGAAVAAFAIAIVLHRKRAITTLAVLPAFAAWIGYVGFGGGVSGWLGLLAGLGLGVIVDMVHRNRSRRQRR